jgi:hypothetical protein
MDNRIVNRFDKVEDRLDAIDRTLVKQENVLEVHVKRTNLLEESLKEVNDKVKPLEIDNERAKFYFKLATKILLAGGALGGSGVGIKALLGIISGS